MSDLESTVRTAHAKINLTLGILGRRPDGFHEIESWIARVELHDLLEIRKADRYSLTVTDDAAIPADQNNLVARAHAALGCLTGRPLPTEFRLHKKIPAGAGLGGGSSDAAEAILGLHELWSLGLNHEDMHRVAAGIGSDVPFFLDPGQAIVTGRGEQVQRIPGWHGWTVLILPGVAIPTAAVYAEYARSPACGARREAAWENSNLPARQLQHLLANDLTDAAFALEPRLASLHNRLDGLAGSRVLMSGSGSTLYAIFDDKQQAEHWLGQAKPLVAAKVRLMPVQIL